MSGLLGLFRLGDGLAGLCPEEQVVGLVLVGFEGVSAVGFVGVDDDLFEDGLVEHAAQRFGGLLVGGSAVLGEVECFDDLGFCVIEICGDGTQLPGDVGVVSFEFCLLLGEQLHGDGVAVVSLEEFALLVLGVFELVLQQTALLKGGGLDQG
ncbi:hypothetical protein HGQ17_01115 [Nesterenkonia sp. MY13]|uniref:Uncharacterized protein n=1 Tax=Nesterenkonia sedimenti TaxID=1463632 RepID=A0A7X8THH6_9MICC|nr:hypothetical protein [Nesterenkonia sedimenti]NLS08626.1 hypothetical protein [Nesterenkonia sedimenti]